MENLEFNNILDESEVTRNFFNDNRINQLKIEICNQGIEWSKINKDREGVRKDRKKIK